MKFRILDEEFEFDFFDLEEVERAETAVKKLETRNSAADYYNMSQSQLIKTQCGIIFDFFDDLFGPGTHQRIFKGKTNLLQALSAFEAFIEAKNSCAKELDAIRNKYSPERVTAGAPNRTPFQPPKSKNGKHKGHH